MKGQKGKWLVISLDGYWWFKGQWLPQAEPGSADCALPKTKQGAFRIAGKCPGLTEILFRAPPKRRSKYPNGYTRSYVYGRVR